MQSSALISFPLYPLYPQGLRQTATFSIQEIPPNNLSYNKRRILN